VAELTKAQLSARVLEHLGVKPAASTASAHDDAFVREAIDAAHARLRKYGLVPFGIDAIPEWAQVPLRDYVAGDTAQSFGISNQRLAEFKAGQVAGERELQRQVSGYRHQLRTAAEYF
jgi:hypothetical protein